MGGNYLPGALLHDEDFARRFGEALGWSADTPRAAPSGRVRRMYACTEVPWLAMGAAVVALVCAGLSLHGRRMATRGLRELRELRGDDTRGGA